METYTYKQINKLFFKFDIIAKDSQELTQEMSYDDAKFSERFESLEAWIYMHEMPLEQYFATKELLCLDTYKWLGKVTLDHLKGLRFHMGMFDVFAYDECLNYIQNKSCPLTLCQAIEEYSDMDEMLNKKLTTKDLLKFGKIKEEFFDVSAFYQDMEEHLGWHYSRKQNISIYDPEFDCNVELWK